MSEQALRDSIKNVLTSINGIGQVHEYERFSRDWSTFLSFFKNPAPDNAIRGFEITKNGFSLAPMAQNFRITHNFVVKGYLGVSDAGKSDILFNTLLLSITQALLDAKLPGPGGKGYAMPQADRIEPREFRGVLCHYCELRYALWDDTQLTPEAVNNWLTTQLDYYLLPEHQAETQTPDAQDEINMPQ